MTRKVPSSFAGESKASQLFESHCPDCDDMESSLEMTHIGGPASFIEGWQTDKGTKVEPNENCPPWLQFRCPNCSAVHFVEQVVGGDWATN